MRTERSMLVGMAAAAGSECSSGCQSGWTTYLDDDRSSYSYSYSRDDAATFHRVAQQQQPCYGCDYSEEEEEDDLSMVSDASSGPRHQHSAGSEEGAAALANARAVRRGGRLVAPAAAARRQSKVAAAVATSTLLEDTASSPAFFKQSHQVMSSPEAGSDAGSMMDISNAADFSCAFFATTGFEFDPPLNVSAQLGGYLQVQYSPAPVNPMPTRQVETEVTRFRGGDEHIPSKSCRCCCCCWL